MIYCVALTGSIASGKSTVLSLFRRLKVPVISADTIARTHTKPGEPAYLAIQEHFGDFAFHEDGRLNRGALRNRILYNRHDRVWLENLLHPLIRESIEKEVLAIKNKPYCIIEIPLLKDCEEYPYINRVLVLLSERETQIERLMERDQYDYDKAALFLSIQPDEKQRLALADDVLINNHSLEVLEAEVKMLHRKYLLLAQET